MPAPSITYWRTPRVDGSGQSILGKPTSHCKQRATQPCGLCAMLPGSGEKRLAGCFRHQADRERIVENERRVEQLVSCAGNSGDEGSAGLARKHSLVLRLQGRKAKLVYDGLPKLLFAADELGNLPWQQ